ncbi:MULTISPECIES: hypothetical protein [Rhizobium]|jgi:hypothetical protein|uniref:hypothetical protein n=1 Tax=Rhizobium TaxID=379 RepID=UPI001C8FF121|nr:MULTISPECIES: hypothetical protein [Rhizobium]MBY3367569.1 hypothetical protein [Rhizobium laguerreae]MBY3516046.1 hypothetical protein [Rhizobium laguerreae]MBY5825437.1 hypothetical protein [Rhizobium leguminosarum]
MIIGDILFWKNSLGDYLRKQGAAIEGHVREHMTAADLERSDDEIVAGMLADAIVGSLSVDFENPERSVNEQRVTVRDHFSGNVTIDGVRVTKSFAFAGDPKLFNLRPSTFDSGPPHGVVGSSRIILGYEGRNDPEAIKSSIADQEAQLKIYLDWSKAEVDAHDAKLPGLLKAAVERRRKALLDLNKLSDF